MGRGLALANIELIVWKNSLRSSPKVYRSQRGTLETLAKAISQFMKALKSDREALKSEREALKIEQEAYI